MRKQMKIIGAVALLCAAWPTAVIAATTTTPTTTTPTTTTPTTTTPTTTTPTTTTPTTTTKPTTTLAPSTGKIATFSITGPPGYTDYYSVKGVTWKVVDAAGSDITARCTHSEVGKGILDASYYVACPLSAGANQLTVARTSDMPADFQMLWKCQVGNTMLPSGDGVAGPVAPNSLSVPGSDNVSCRVTFGPPGVYFVQKYSDAQTGGKPVSATLTLNGVKVPCVNDPRWATSPSGGPYASSVSWCTPPVSSSGSYAITPEVVPPVAGYRAASYWNTAVPPYFGWAQIDQDVTAALKISTNSVPPVKLNAQTPWAVLVTNLVADPVSTTTTTTLPPTTIPPTTGPVVTLPATR